jgi:hypothetical protein
MTKLFLGLVSVALLVGCSSKEEQALVKSYKKNMAYNKHLQQTEKVELTDSNDTVMAIVTATYMYTPNFEKNDTRNETFIVGVTFEEPDYSSMVFTNKTINSADTYSLTMQGKNALHSRSLSPNDKKLKGISFVTQWGKYYEVTYPHIESKQLSLTLKNSIYGNRKLNFAKVAKFVYTQKGF